MPIVPLKLIVLPGQYVVCKLEPQVRVPSWAESGGFLSITRTDHELSIVCEDDGRVPADAKCERGWGMMRVAGTQAFSATGILSSVLEPLAFAKVGIFAISTFDTDFVLVKLEMMERAVASLRAAGHEVQM